MSDPGSTYRTRDEISSMRQLRDPVEHVRKLLLDKAGADPAELKKIEKVCLILATCAQWHTWVFAMAWCAASTTSALFVTHAYCGKPTELCVKLELGYFDDLHCAQRRMVSGH